MLKEPLILFSIMAWFSKWCIFFVFLEVKIIRISLFVSDSFWSAIYISSMRYTETFPGFNSVFAFLFWLFPILNHCRIALHVHDIGIYSSHELGSETVHLLRLLYYQTQAIVFNSPFIYFGNSRSWNSFF